MATVESVPQPLLALQQANATRRAGVIVRQLIAGGTLTVREALADSRAGHLPVREVLRAQPGWGYGRAGTVLREQKIAETRRVRMLTERQREMIGMACDAPVCDHNLLGDMWPALRLLAEADHPVLAKDLYESGFRKPGGTLAALARRGLVEGRLEEWTCGRLCWTLTDEGRRVAQER